MLSALPSAPFDVSRSTGRGWAAGWLLTLLVFAVTSCVDDPVSPRREPQHSGVSLALRASISGLAVQGTYSLRLAVTSSSADGTPTELEVTPDTVPLTAGTDPGPQSFTIDMAPCPQGCLLTATLTLTDEIGELATATKQLGLVHQGDQVSPPDSIVLVPSYTLTIVGGGGGTGNGTVTAPASGDQPALTCEITDGETAASGCVGRYPLHTTIALTASDRLETWGDDGAGCEGSACDVTLDGRRTVSATFVKPPTTGGLIVQIGGLPAGVAPQVAVTGPGAFAQAVSQTDTIGELQPGGYIVNATPVNAAGVTFSPGPAQQTITVAPGDTATAQVGYNPPDVGSLTVGITGLPASVAPVVSVVGPAFSQPLPLTQDTTLSNLEPGLYTITAQSVETADQIYTPSEGLSQPVAVAVNQTTQAHVTYTPTLGSLTVAVSGLPTKVNAVIAVTGPGGFSRALTKTTPLPKLAIGSYTIAAGNVPTQGVTYAPDQPSQTIDVGAGAQLRASVGYSALPPTTLEKVKDSTTCQVNSFCDDLLEARAKDAAGNVVAGATVRWTAGDPSPPGCPIGESADVLTDGTGIARASNVCKYPTPGTYHQSAALVVGGQVLTGTTVAFTFTLVPGGVSPDRSTVQVTPDTIRTCCDTATVTVTARDASGNPVEGIAVALSTSGAPNILIGPDSPTDSRGVAIARIASRMRGSKLISAIVGGVSLRQQVPLEVIAGIVFTSRLSKDNREISVVSRSGSNQVSLTSSTELDAFAPAWSPDGSKIAFAATPACQPGQECFENPKIYLMEADGTGRVNLTPNLVGAYSPTWSPRDGRIAFSGSNCPEGFPFCNRDIYIMSSDGSGLVKVTNTPTFNEDNPSWSPDGLRIAFDSRAIAFGDSADFRDIFVTNLSGQDTTVATNSSEIDESEPAWSPDGSSIAFVSDGDLFVMDSSGGDPHNLIQTVGRAEQGPAWSPDGSEIAFSLGNLYVMSANGSNPVLIPIGDAAASEPNWR